MTIKIPKYEIKQQQQQQSYVRKHWVIFGLMALAVATFLLGRFSQIDILNAFKGQKETWSEVNEQLSTEVEANRKTIQNLQLTQKINQQALDELQLNLAESLNENATLQAELAFYENLLGNKDRIRQLKVFELSALPVDDLIEIKLVLAQKLEKAQVIKGKIALHLKGIQQDKGVELDLIEQFKLNNVYEFKYFQVINYIIKLPEGFNPTALSVELQGSGRNSKVITESFLWSDVFDPQEPASNAALSNSQPR